MSISFQSSFFAHSIQAPKPAKDISFSGISTDTRDIKPGFLFVALTVLTRDVPYIPAMDRVELQALEEGIYKMTAEYGFMQTPNIREIFAATTVRDTGFEFKGSAFFLGRETILASDHPGMPIWREKFFAFMSRNAQRATAFFDIPPDQVIEVGIQVEI